MRRHQYKMASFAEHGDSHQSHEGVFITFLSRLENPTSAYKLHEAECSVHLLEGESEVEHHAPEETETSKDASYGSDVSQEQIILNVHTTENFV